MGIANLEKFMNKATLAEKIVAFLNNKHSRKDIDEDSILEDIGEDCDFSLMFELAKEFNVDDRCDGDEIGEHASVYNAIDAIWGIM